MAEVLKGSKSKKVMQFGLDRLSTYGLLQDMTEKEIVDLINVLIAEGYLSLTEGQYPLLRLTGNAAPVLNGQANVFQKVQPEKQAVIVMTCCSSDCECCAKNYPLRRTCRHISFSLTTPCMRCPACVQLTSESCFLSREWGPPSLTAMALSSWV